MTDPVSAGTPARRTRRQLLAGGTGALAAVLTAEALARPAPAYADDGNPVILGANNSETNTTSITTTTSGATALECVADGVGVLGSGLVTHGVFGSSDSGRGVFGASNTGHGVEGSSGTANGVLGVSAGASASGVLGQNTGGGEAVTGNIDGNAAAMHGFNTGSGVGVRGDSFGGFGVAGHSDSYYGVLGDTGAATVSGVWGTHTNGGLGVLGTSASTSGIGVRGECAAGIGVNGQAASSTGTGVMAENTGGGNALVVSGIAAFTNCGLLTVAAGKSSATQPGVALTKASLVLANLQEDRAGVWIRSAVPNIAGQSVTVRLNKAVTAATIVAWFTVDQFFM